MIPNKKDIEIYQGEDFILAFCLVNAEGLDVKITSDIKANRMDAEPVASFEVEREDDLVILRLPAEKNNAIKLMKNKNTFVYDIKLSLNGQLRYIQQGDVFIYKGVTT